MSVKIGIALVRLQIVQGMFAFQNAAEENRCQYKIFLHLFSDKNNGLMNSA